MLKYFVFLMLLIGFSQAKTEDFSLSNEGYSMSDVPYTSQENMSICYAHAAQQLFDTVLAKEKGPEFKPTSPLYAAYLYKSKNWLNINGGESFNLAIGGVKKTLQYMMRFGSCPAERVDDILPAVSAEAVSRLMNTESSDNNGRYQFSVSDLLSDLFRESAMMRPALDRLGRALSQVCDSRQIQQVNRSKYEVKERLNIFRSPQSARDESWSFVKQLLKEEQNPVAASVCGEFLTSYDHSDESLLNCINNHVVVIVGYRILPSGHKSFYIRDSQKRSRYIYSPCTEPLGADCQINERLIDAEDLLKMAVRFFYIKEK